MRCLVCGREFDAETCPVCQFPVVRFPGDPEEGLRAMQPTIDAYREHFLSGVRIGIVTYRWKDDGGTLAVDRKETVWIGTGAELYGREGWIAERFARIPEVPSLEVELSVSVGGRETVRKVNLPNRQEAQLQEIGAALDPQMHLRLLLRNEAGQTQSEEIPLFS